MYIHLDCTESEQMSKSLRVRIPSDAIRAALDKSHTPTYIYIYI